MTTVKGAAALHRTLLAAADQLRDLTGTHRDVAALVVAAAAAGAPVRSGALRRSLHARVTDAGTHVTSDLRYAGPIHWGWAARHVQGQPFVAEAASRTESRWVALYADQVERAVASVRGA